jgi:type IX secretion system PorP/SprF family membrane protein
MRKLIFIVSILLFHYILGFSQQSPVFSQYVLNEFVINPSVAGIDGTTTINLTGRKQWVGIEFAPNTYLVSVSSRLLKTNNVILGRTKGPNKFKRGSSGRVGLGASLIDDNNAAINRIGLNLTYSYHIFIQNSQLSFGLSFLMQQFKIDKDLAKFASSDENPIYDPANELIGKSTYMPDAAFGINISSKHYSAGLSAFQLFQTPVKFGDVIATNNQIKQLRNYIASGWYRNVIRSSPEWEYEPSVLIRSTEKLQTRNDFSIRLIYKREYWGGLSYRFSENKTLSTSDFIVFAGLKYNKIYVGYSFDYGINEISRLSYGSHEISVAIKLGDSNRRYRYWERY